MDVFVELKAVISDFQEKMAVAREEMAETSKTGSSKFSALSSIGKGALLGVAGTVVAVSGLAVKMGNELEDSRAKLETALRDAGTSFDAFKGPITAADKAMEKFGFTNAQTEAALSVGVTATGSASKALDMVQTAANLAAYKHVDLSTAMTVVAKATEGNLRALKQLGIDLPINAKNAEALKVAQENLRIQTENYGLAVEKLHAKHTVTSIDLQTLSVAHQKLVFAQQQVNQAQNAGGLILDALNQKLGGQAAAAADTFSGKIQAAKARTEDLLASLGLKLIPVLEKVVLAVVSAVGWFEKHQAITKALAIVVGTVLTAAIAAYVASMAVAAAETIIAAAPILAIIGAVAGLAFGIYELSTHWKQVWHDINQWTDDAISFLRSGFGTLVVLVLGPLAPLALLALHWQQVLTGIKQVTGQVVSALLSTFRDLGDAFFAVIEGILGAASHLPFVGHYFAEANRSVKDAQNSFDTTLSSWSSDASSWGQTLGNNLTAGITNTIKANIPAGVQSAGAYIAQVIGAMHKGAQTASPSKLTMLIGQHLAEGLEVGMASRQQELTGVAAQVAASTAAAMSRSFGQSNAVTSGPTISTAAPLKLPSGDVYLQVDGQTFARIARTVLLQLQRSTSLGFRAA